MKLLLKILFYFCLVMGGLFVVGLIMLSSFSGNSESWRKQVEDIGGGVTGKKIAIGQMHDARLFPHLAFRGEYIFAAPPPVEVSQMSEEELAQKTPADLKPSGKTYVIGKLDVSIPFWTIFWGAPAIQIFNLQGALIAGQEHSAIRNLKLAWSENSEPFLEFDGAYNKVQYEGTLDLKKAWGGARIHNDMMFDIILDDIPATGHLKLEQGRLRLSDLEMVVNDQTLNGDILFSVNDIGGNDNYNVTIQAQDKPFLSMMSIEGEGVIETDVTYLDQLQVGAAQKIIELFCTIYEPQYISTSILDAPSQVISCANKEIETTIAPEDVSE